jgi:hypothetical protein
VVQLGLATLAVGSTLTWSDADALFAQGDDADGATGTLSGQVTDASGAPLPGATVTLLSPALDAGDLVLTTDSAGRFILAVAPVGLYDVQAECDGFRAGVLGAVPVKRDQTAQATVVLEPRVAGDGGY